MNDKVTILCAGPGLGFYVPGIIIQRQLNQSGIPAETYVFEEFLVDNKKANLKKTKENFHRNFSFALMGQKLAKDPSESISIPKMESLVRGWIHEGRDKFIVLSGFWLPIIHRFLALYEGKAKIDLCHVDADYSSSWRLFDTSSEQYNEIWFNHWETKKINFYLDIDGEAPVPFHERKDEFMLHGGGWGMGTYKSKKQDLNAHGFRLNILAYETPDLEQDDSINNYFLMNPAWNTWDTLPSGEHMFPPLSPAKTGAKELSERLHQNEDRYPSLYNLLKYSKAIISKPGAGTLLDSLSSATPLIILEPFGEYENKNGKLWKEYGMGISFEDWASSGFSESILEQLHRNLLEKRSETSNYVTTYIKRFFNHGI